jgi:hypothetical protein
MSSILPDPPIADSSSHSFIAPSERSEAPVTVCSDSSQVETRAEQLREVAAQIEEFLLRQIDRLQEEISKAAESAGELNLGSLQEEFERMREQLEEERREEMDQIREDAQRLAESWQMLETEQRELLMRQATIRTVPSPATTEVDGLGEASPLHPMRLTPAGAVTTVGAEIRAIAGGATIQKAQLQFQQLRREMQRHAQQGKKY